MRKSKHDYIFYDRGMISIIRMIKNDQDVLWSYHNTFTPQWHPFLFLITFTFIRCIHFFLTLFFPPPLTLLPRNNFLVGIFQFLSHRHSMDRPLLISRLPRSAIPETTFPFLASYFFLSVLPSCSSGSPCYHVIISWSDFFNFWPAQISSLPPAHFVHFASPVSSNTWFHIWQKGPITQNQI